MANAMHVPPAGFDDLPVDDQIDYVNFLWDRIRGKRQALPVPSWHIELLEARHAEIQANEDGGQSWEEFEAELRGELASRRG